MSDFFILHDPLIDTAFLGKTTLTEAEGRALARGETVPTEPVVLHHAMGSQVSDVIWTTSIKPVVVHERVISLLEENALTGWATYPVQVIGGDGLAVPDYRGLAITGRCGPIDDSRSDIVMKTYPAGEFPVYRGLFFDPGSWDGSDLFVSDDSASWPFVSARVCEALKGKATNLDFIKAAELERAEL
jgi:hypothetical protein